jgi:4-amino-4-deoxy-L-arabinose transferase-like glycosyltransferase
LGGGAFVGSVGLWERAHPLSPELGLMLGIAAALYGFALALRRPVAGGAMLGLGAGIGFLSAGFVAIVWTGLTAAALPAAFSAWRTRRHALTVGVALAVGTALAAPGRSRSHSARPAICTRGGRHRQAISWRRWTRRRRATQRSC